MPKMPYPRALRPLPLVIALFAICSSASAPPETTRRGIGNTAAAVSTLLAAAPDFKLALANVPDVTLLPEARAALAANPSLAPKFTQVRSLIETYNESLAFQFASNSRV